jgi:hypothetical protein
MKNFTTLAISLNFLFTTMMETAHQLTPEQVVQKNLDCYNRRDINGFMKSFSQNIALFTFSESTATASGLEAIRAMYKELFDLSPGLHSTILKRIVIGNKVIDHETITGRRGAKEPVEMVLIYEVKENKIYRITAIRQ